MVVELDRTDAVSQIEGLLVREGREDLVLELRRVVALPASADAYASAITAVTRALLENEKTYRLVFTHELDPMSLFDVESVRQLDLTTAMRICEMTPRRVFRERIEPRAHRAFPTFDEWRMALSGVRSRRDDHAGERSATRRLDGLRARVRAAGG